MYNSILGKIKMNKKKRLWRKEEDRRRNNKGCHYQWKTILEINKKYVINKKLER